MKPLHSFSPPLAAILRGLPVVDAVAVAQALLEAGFRLIEVPLNRPGALPSIEAIARLAPADALVGGGTVLTPADVDAVAQAGGRWVVSPNCDTAVIDRAVALGLYCVPGVGTASEAFTALRHGAHALKLFPAEVWGPRGLKALKSVLPADTLLWPVGGVSVDNLKDWITAGADGFGIGGQLYQPGAAAESVRREAERFMRAWRSATARDGAGMQIS
jgi:2-dehydro-3-deoxyphosphogalactonate aldolase